MTLAAERAVIGALLTGTLRPRDWREQDPRDPYPLVDIEDRGAWANHHHAFLATRVLVPALDECARLRRSGAPRVDVLMRFSALMYPNRGAHLSCYATADESDAGEAAAIPLVDVARAAPRRGGALEAARAMLDLWREREDARRTREQAIDSLADLVSPTLLHLPARDRSAVIRRAVQRRRLPRERVVIDYEVSNA